MLLCPSPTLYRYPVWRLDRSIEGRRRVIGPARYLRRTGGFAAGLLGFAAGAVLGFGAGGVLGLVAAGAAG
jgi:hypothetical protein